jgi:uncharacterized protein (TIGR02594 family)
VQIAQLRVNYEGTILMLFRQRTLLAICSIAFSVTATSAFADVGESSENLKAQPVVTHRAGKAVHAKRKAVKVVRTHQATAAYSPAPTYSADAATYTVASQPAPVARGRKAARVARTRAAAAQASASATTSWGSSSSLVSEARRYLGTNPTNRRSLWCGAFMDMVLRKTGHQGGGNLASGYARYGTRVSGPQVGAIAVMGRRGGGHVGVVSGVDAKGNVIVVSGNHNNTVAESVYPRGRIYAYVMPNS